MAKRAHHRDRQSRAALVLVVAFPLGSFLAACSDANGIQTTPPTSADSPAVSAAPTPSAVVTTEAATERLVTERYVEFQRVVAEAGATSDADDPRLSEYATGAVLENLRGKLAVRRQSGTRLYGAPVSHVQSVSVAGDRATIRDCLDNSATGLVDRSGKKLSVGRARQETTATLTREQGTWKVSEIETVAGGGSC